MEFGDHCSYKKCSRLDFLPFTCEHCHKIFCKDHNLPQQHDCTSSTTRVTSNELDSTSSKTVESLKSYSCSAEGCRRKELVEVLCSHCNGNFCLQHRHQTDHDCPALSVQKSSTKTISSSKEVNPGQQSKATKNRRPLSDKAARMEAKVRLMKLKMKAEGSPSIPQAERVYFSVRLPSDVSCGSQAGLPQADTPMYFSKEWSMGKVIDFIAQKHKLTNNNHLSQAPERLVLHDVSGQPFDVRQTLHSLQDSLCSGSVIVLKVPSRDRGRHLHWI